jgi:hypothetical protein
MQKPHHNIRNLHAGVVDVVLHIHLLPGSPQQPHKRVAENRIAQVPHVRSLVGIDAGVLNKRMNATRTARQALSTRNRMHTRPRDQTAH